MCVNVSDEILLPQTGSRDKYLSINGITRDTWSPLCHIAEKVEVKILIWPSSSYLSPPPSLGSLAVW